MTPYEKPRSEPAAEGYLKSGTTLEKSDALAARFNDNHTAQHHRAEGITFSINKYQQSAA